jgi:glucose-6-phosphate 1-dehydrogenase
VKLAKTEPDPPAKTAHEPAAKAAHEPAARTARKPAAKAEPDAPGEVAPNPLAAGLERLPVAPTNLVIFGATGDLARRKLLPAIYNLAHEGALPGQFNLIGVSRGEHSNEEYRDIAAEAIRAFSRTKVDENVLSGLLDELRYVTGAFDDPATYTDVAAALDELDEAAGESMSRAFYLSTAPEFFAVIVEALGSAGLAATEGAEVRVIIEKPFGTSLAEARALNVTVLSVFQESQVFRIDHYLGKETVQNMLAFRFANGMFEPLWNRNYIANVQITAAEDIGIGSRAGYYDHAGALRDLVENHMMQLLTLLCMEPPVTFAANDVRDEKVKVLHAIRTPQPAELAQMSVRAQYGAGVSGGEPVVGYLQEAGVPADSHTETYAALRLEVDNWRWAGVPFYLRTGKRLARKVTEIAVTLRPVPHLAFEQDGSLGVRPNQLVLTIQPNEGVSLALGAKIPGTRMRIRTVIMEFLYGTAFLSQSPEAYERLILDAMRGDATLFTRNDEVEAQWRICDPVVSAWEADATRLPQYAAGTQGPVQADSLLLEGHEWRAI